MVSKDLLNSVCENIYKRYPDYQGISPKVSAKNDRQVLFVFTRKTKTEDGLPITVRLRVCAEEDGKIKSVSESK